MFEPSEIAINVAIYGGLGVLICLFIIARLAYENTRIRQKRIELEMRLRKYHKREQFDFQVLAKGNFGITIKQKLREIKVAVKRKSNFEVNQYEMLKHPKIVNNIGFVCDISHGHLYLVELCAESLENQLKSAGKNSHLIFISELGNPYQNGPGGNRYLHEDLDNWPVTKAALKGKIFHSDLISYAYQVALAMEYLASLRIVHRNLTSRNVLLSHNFKVAKIGDFGLGLQLDNHNYNTFGKQETLQVPIKWTAPESILFKEFSSGSDVWSFGLLLGEIFSLGEIPFSHLTHNQFLSDVSKKEITPIRPRLASDNIYQLMLNCCRFERQSRISFTEAKEQLSEEFHRCSPEQMTSLLALLGW